MNRSEVHDICNWYLHGNYCECVSLINVQKKATKTNKTKQITTAKNPETTQITEHNCHSTTTTTHFVLFLFFSHCFARAGPVMRI